MGRGEGHGGRPVAYGQHRQLGAGKALLDDHRPPGVAEGRSGEVGPDSVDGLNPVRGDHHALAGGQPVGLDHEQVTHTSQEGQGGRLVIEGPVGGSRHARLDEHLLHPRLGSLQAGAVGSRTEDQATVGPQPVG